jgi:hypothetical protein
MKRTRAIRACLGFALLMVVAVPLHADPSSDLFALFFQANGVAASSGFTQGERISLVAKVIHAERDVERGNDNAAVNNLGAFINEVEALERSGRLAPADAAALINSANAIVGEL